RVRQIVKMATQTLYAYSPSELQKRYDIRNFSYKKPITEEVDFRREDARRGQIHTIFEAARSGKSAQEIQDEINPSLHEWARARRLGRKHGVNVPYMRYGNSKEFHNSINELTDPEISSERKQQLLGQVNRGYFQYNGDDPDAPIMKLSEIIKEAELY